LTPRSFILWQILTSKAQRGIFAFANFSSMTQNNFSASSLP
jgi:hypothetical protein